MADYSDLGLELYRVFATNSSNQWPWVEPIRPKRRRFPFCALREPRDTEPAFAEVR